MRVSVVYTYYYGIDGGKKTRKREWDRERPKRDGKREKWVVFKNAIITPESPLWRDVLVLSSIIIGRIWWMGVVSIQGDDSNHPTTSHAVLLYLELDQELSGGSGH